MSGTKLHHKRASVALLAVMRVIYNAHGIAIVPCPGSYIREKGIP